MRPELYEVSIPDQPWDMVLEACYNNFWLGLGLGGKGKACLCLIV